MDTFRFVLVICLICQVSMATAGSIYKCKDEKGQVTFSQTKCGDDAVPQELKSVPTVQGGQKSAAEQLQEMRAIRQSGKPKTTKSTKTPRKSDCPYISSTARKNKIRGDEVFKCMTKSELQSVVGRRPDSVRRGSDGNDSWHWYLGSNSFHAYFDGDGKLKSWSGWSR